MLEPQDVGQATSSSHVSFLCPFTNFYLENVKDIDMNTQDSTKAVQPFRGGLNPLCISLTADVLPKAKAPDLDERLRTGVFIRNAHKRKKHKYALCMAYGREKNVSNFIIAHSGTAFYSTITAKKVVNGKKELEETSRFPKIFFAYGAEDDITSFAYDTHNLPFSRFYYTHTHKGAKTEKTPLIVNDSQIWSLMNICKVNNSDVLITREEIRKFMTGDIAKVTEGNFKGLLTAITAYVPSIFIENQNKIDEKN